MRVFAGNREATLFKLLLMLLFVSVMSLSRVAHAEIFTITTPPQDGVTVTTTIDTELNRVSYTLDLSGLAYNYEQISFSPAPLPAFAAIPLEWGAVSSPALTEWNFHPISGSPDWNLELQYFSRPPELSFIDINYLAGTPVTGGFVGQAGDDNVVVTLVRPPEGFPPGQPGEITLWAYTPHADSTPSVALLLPRRGSVVSGRIALFAYSANPSAIRQITFAARNTAAGAVVPLGTDAAAPYLLLWDTSGVANGSYQIVANAEDIYGNHKSSVTRVTVAN